MAETEKLVLMTSTLSSSAIQHVLQRSMDIFRFAFLGTLLRSEVDTGKMDPVVSPCNEKAFTRKAAS